MEVDLDQNGREKRWIYDLLGLFFQFILSLQGILRYSRLLPFLYLPTLGLILIITEAR